MRFLRVFAVLSILLTPGTFIVGENVSFHIKFAEAKVLFEQSKIGTPYDLYKDVGSGLGMYLRLPQYSGTSTYFPGGGTQYEGTAEWFRVKRISGVSCESALNVAIADTSGVRIGTLERAITNGPYCDFRITGPERENRAFGAVTFCVSNSCVNDKGDMVLDGSPLNDGYVMDGYQKFIEPGGYAFQVCDSGGCSGGFGQSTTTATTTPAATSTTPEGASSVLFLPGLLGSHLHEDSLECGDSGSLLEKRRWLSRTECDQLRMQTNLIGKSVNNLYTYGGERGIIKETYTFNVYKSFIESLKEWRNTQVIKDFALIPYDWRLSISDILLSQLDSNTGKINANTASTLTQGYMYKEVERLVSESFSGKVTIVAHSNGGLVAKQFLAELKRMNDPLLEKIDNLILVAVPQVGTPDAVWALLHGTELGNGLVMSNKTSRQLLNTMPFAYHLLPNQNYFSGSGVSVSTPVITFEPGDATSAWRATFGAEIKDRANLFQFLDKNSGRINPATSDLLTPEIVDQTLLNYAEVQETLQGNWVPPTSLKVYQIAGTGLETPSGLTYFTDKKCIARSPLSLFRCTEYASKLGYRVNMTLLGDQTVVVPSALSTNIETNVEKLWVNLLDYNENEIDRKHNSILEVDDVRKFILYKLTAATSSIYSYITNSPPIINIGNKLVFQLHSPLDLSISTNLGVVSSSSRELEGALYRRFGEVQYVSIPGNMKDIVVKMQGLATGSFTLDIDEIRNEALSKRKTYSAIPVATTSKIIIEIGEVSEVGTAVINVDYDGNGTSDVKYNTEGEITVPASYKTLLDAIQELQTRSIYKLPLVVTARLAESYFLKSKTSTIFLQLEKSTLRVLREAVLLLERKKLITVKESGNIVEIINKLLIS